MRYVNAQFEIHLQKFGTYITNASTRENSINDMYMYFLYARQNFDWTYYGIQTSVCLSIRRPHVAP